MTAKSKTNYKKAEKALQHVLQHVQECPCDVALTHVEDGAAMIVSFIDLSHSMSKAQVKEGNKLGDAVEKLIEGHSTAAVIQALRPWLETAAEIFFKNGGDEAAAADVFMS